jgi:hypothetical protein
MDLTSPSNLFRITKIFSGCKKNSLKLMNHILFQLCTYSNTAFARYNLLVNVMYKIMSDNDAWYNSCTINMVFNNKGGKQAKGIWKQDPEVNIWAQEGWEWWRRFHNGQHNSLYCSPNTVRVFKYIRLRWAGHITRMEKGKSVFKILTGKTTGKRFSGRPMRLESIIRMDLKEMLL